MIACWPFDETKGTTFADSARSYDATCSGAACPGFTGGKINGGLLFDGVQDTLTVPDNSALWWGKTDSFTVEAWVRGSASCDGNTVILGKPGDGSSSAAWWLGCSEGSNTAVFYVCDSAGNSFSVKGRKSLTDGQWHHLAGVRDSAANELRLYVDGDRTVTSAGFGGHFTNHSNLQFGAFDNRHYLNARVDEAALYLRAVSESELRGHYYLARQYCKMCEKAVRIMPLGDSITRGTGSTNYNGYRKRLYTTLRDNGFNVNFVGGLQDGDTSFDRDHEGHGGWHASGGPSGGILPNVYDWLVANPADVVLLHIGTNDISSGGQNASEVDQILDEIDRYSPDVTVILALIINRAQYSPATSRYNGDLQTMAEKRIANGDKIIIVDMESALKYPDDMVDNIHPNDGGYRKMADRWLEKLKIFLPVCR